MEDCVIFFLHHNDDAITRRHLELFRERNSSFKVVPLTPSSHPQLPFWDYDSMWMYNDTMVYRWMLSSDYVKARRYCLFDWDTRCDGTVDEYYKDVWDAPAAATSIHTVAEQRDWAWFERARANAGLAAMEDKFRGMVPMCGSLFAHDVLFDIINEQMKHPELWRAQNNEFRAATCAKVVGVEPVVVGRNTIQPFASGVRGEGLIVHPVKTLDDDGMRPLESRRRLLVVSVACSLSTELHRDLDASREAFPGWNVHYIGKGRVMTSYIDAKLYMLRDFLILNRDMFDYVLYIDSNDVLFTRPFDEEALLSAFAALQSDVVFCGEAQCYPMPQLEALYHPSDARLRYLNSGCFMSTAAAALPLLNHAIELYERYPQYKTLGWNPPGDQTYLQLCLFSKSLGLKLRVDEGGSMFAATYSVPDDAFTFDGGELRCDGARPFMLHCQSDDKHARKREFMRKLNIPVRG